MNWNFSPLVEQMSAFDTRNLLDLPDSAVPEERRSVQSSKSIMFKPDPNEITHFPIDDLTQGCINHKYIVNGPVKPTFAKKNRSQVENSSRRRTKKSVFAEQETKSEIGNCESKVSRKCRIRKRYKANRHRGSLFRKRSTDLTGKQMAKETDSEMYFFPLNGNMMDSNYKLNCREDEDPDHFGKWDKSSFNENDPMDRFKQNAYRGKDVTSEHQIQKPSINRPALSKLKKKRRYRYRKVFDPKKFFENNQKQSSPSELQQKFGLFLFLPQFIFLNDLWNLEKSGTELISKSKKRSQPSKKLASSTDPNTSVSMTNSVLERAKPKRLSEEQKHRKIAKKLKRAWNLNQQIPVNVFKKQVGFSRISYQKEFPSENPDFKEQPLTIPHSPDPREFNDSSLGLTSKKGPTSERKSKLKARNKIQNSILRQRKLRAPSGQGKEQSQYKRLVGPKRNIDQLRDLESGKKSYESFLTPIVKQSKENKASEKLRTSVLGNFENGLFCRRNTNERGDSSRKRAHQGRLEYVEFLDFSFKNINKPNFLVTDHLSK